MKIRLYTLSDDNEPVECFSLPDWQEWNQKGLGTVAYSEVHNTNLVIEVLTAFIGVTPDPDIASPRMYRTTARYSNAASYVAGSWHTWAEAEEGHKGIIARLTKQEAPAP